MTKNILLTGRPGVGKTTVVMRVVGELRGRVPVSGFYTEEIRSGGVRKGFRVVTLDGREGILSHVDIKGGPRVGKYGVDLESFERLAVPEIDPDRTGAKVIVIDEIGKMECLSGSFREAVLKALNSGSNVLATIALKGGDYLRSIRGRNDVEIIEVSAGNRDRLHELLTERLI